MSPEQFRNLFPALRSMVWLDTPAAPPGAEPVVRALADALSAWSAGEFSRLSWNQATDEARELFARFIGVIHHDPDVVRSDYVAVHGYKWLLCPRGAAWLVTRPDRLAELKPKTIKLRISRSCQGRLACEDVDMEGGLVAAAVDAQAL